MRYLLITCFCLPSILFAQKLNKYWLEFSDKNQSAFSIHQASDFLSPRALGRRANAGISIDETDLPVNSIYLNTLKINGLRIHGASKWLNGAAVIADSNQIKIAKTLPFVRSITFVGPHILPKNPNFRRVRRANMSVKGREETGEYFGYAGLQLSLMNEHFLHFLGKTGQGKMVAVMDGGFINGDTLPFFDSLFCKNKILQGRDFVENDGSIFESASHGTAVLSVMAADLPGYFMGASPEATFVLMKTEDNAGEFPIEEINWVLGAEFADSIGADVLNASLGYTSFNDNSLSHNYLQLDGRTTLASRGAKIGAKKGMIICNSAGNEGDEPWHFIGAPADADGVIAVGGVQFSREKATFSSFGPTADGRLKPDLCAPAQMVIAAGINGYDLTQQNGTSLASPLLAGSLAALWSAFPEKTSVEILDATYRSASQFKKPDNALGWGMPDFFAAWLDLKGFSTKLNPNSSILAKISVENEVEITCLESLFSRNSTVEFRSIDGVYFSKTKAVWSDAKFPETCFFLEKEMPRGAYQLRIVDQNQVLSAVFIR
jgi:serine protease AprX